MLQNRLFVALASRSSFGAAIPVVIMYKKASLCNFFFCKSLLCVNASPCVKASLCKSLLCVKASLFKKLAVCV